MRSSLFEYAFIIAYVTVFLATGLGVYEQKLNHPYPTGYFASDAFFHQSEATWLKEQGIVKYALPSMEGGRKDVYDSHPPFVFEATGILSYATGLEVYDTIYLLAILMLLLLGLTIYAIIRRYNKNVAMMAIPLTLLVYTSPFSQAIFFGQWLFIAGALFMAASFWATSRLEEKHMFLPLAIFLAATAIAHQPELLFAGMFLTAYLAARWIKKKHPIKEFAPIIIAGIIALALSAYSLNIFRMTWMKTYLVDVQIGLTTGTGVNEKGFSDISLQTMGITTSISITSIIGLMLIAGAIITALLIITKKKTDIWPGWISLFILLISYLTFLGIGKRAFAHRWLWHFYFAFFFGLAAYYALKHIIKSWNIAYTAIIAGILIIAFAYPSYGKTTGSLMDQENWEAMSWIRENIPENASMHIFDLGRLQQSATLYNARRVSYIIHRNSYINAYAAQDKQINTLKDIKIIDTYEFGLASAYSHLLCDRKTFDYGYYHSYLPETDPECHDEFKEPITPERNTKLCNMEYYYINVAENERSEATIYNQALAQKLTEKEWIKQIYRNQKIIILKNNKPGDECI